MLRDDELQASKRPEETNQLWCPILSEGHGVFERIWRIYLILDHILAYYISAEDSSCNNIHPQMRIPLIENEYIL